jgi:hypothetical protein
MKSIPNNPAATKRDTARLAIPCALKPQKTAKDNATNPQNAPIFIINQHNPPRCQPQLTQENGKMKSSEHETPYTIPIVI